VEASPLQFGVYTPRSPSLCVEAHTQPEWRMDTSSTLALCCYPRLTNKIYISSPRSSITQPLRTIQCPLHPLPFLCTVNRGGCLCCRAACRKIFRSPRIHQLRRFRNFQLSIYPLISVSCLVIYIVFYQISNI